MFLTTLSADMMIISRANKKYTEAKSKAGVIRALSIILVSGRIDEKCDNNKKTEIIPTALY